MAKAKAVNESNTDGLEIISIGTLYDGAWDKKYWSSSRGKDRYPYPIGYHALRTHNGVTYKLEIHEGSTGPLFQITSSDGHSGSGQTPDIAWEAFQKKTSRIKLWPTKRFSCKVYGVEFFGFKNTLVQRLLRESLASLDEASEQSLPSINAGNRSLTKEGDIPSADLSIHPSLVSHAATSRITGKRRKKCKTTTVNSSQKLDHKTNSIKVQIKDKDENPALVSSLREEYANCNGAQAMPSSVNLNHHQDVLASATNLSCKSYQVSSIDGTSEQSLPSISVGNRSFTKEGNVPSEDLSKHPDLVSYLTTFRITGKRRKKCKTTSVNSAQKLDDKTNSIKIQIKDKDENPALVSSFREEYVSCNGVQDISSSVNLNRHQNVPASATELPCKSYKVSSDCEGKHYSVHLEGQLLESRSHLTSLPAYNEHFEQETPSVLQPDRLRCLEVQTINPSVANEHKVEGSQTIDDSEIFEDSEIPKSNLLYAPDTLDTQQFTDNLYLDPHNLQPDVSKCLEVQKVNPSVASEQKVEGSQTANDSEVFVDSEITKNSFLYAPDTLDTQQGNASSPNITSTEEPAKMDERGADNIITSGEPVGESCPEDETMDDSAEKSDFDSVGQEATKAMVMILLPQALPFLTYSSRKKKRRRKPLKESSSTLRTDYDNNEILPSADVVSYGELAGNSNFDMQKEEHMPNKYLGSAVQSTEITVVPDSLENNRCRADLTYQVNGLSDVTESGKANLGKCMSSPDKRRMLSTVHSIMESGTCQSRVYLEKEPETLIPTEYHVSATSSSEKPTILEYLQNDQSEADVVNQRQHLSCASDAIAGNSAAGKPPEGKPTTLEYLQNDQSEADIVNQRQHLSFASDAVAGNSAAGKPLEEHILMLDSAVDCTSIGREVHKSMDNCLHLDDTSRIESQSRKGESAATLDCNGGRIQCNTLGLVNSLSTPGEEQPIRTGVCGAGNSNICQSSNVELFLRNYNGPLSESIICRNIDDGSLVKEEASSSVNENKDVVADAASRPRRPLHDLLDEKMHEVVTSNKLECNTKVIGCYSHPKQISAVMLKLEADNLYVCTSCGLLGENGRDLFLYKLRIKDPSLGCPSFMGHSSIILPVMKDDYGREVDIERSGLQFTPDARGLVMLDSIKVPYCSERRFQCPCSMCASMSFEDNAVKIVQLMDGYVSLVVKFKTVYPVNSVLACEPDCLVALDESGRLYLWCMDPVWSASTEDYVMPSYDFVASRVVELKKIPNSASLLLGHNGCGDFSLWDITRRTILSTFSAPASSFLGFLPISLYNWKNGQVYGKGDAEKCKDELTAAATAWSTEFSGKMTFPPMEGEDIGIWILACTSSDSNYQPKNCQDSPGSWRLGLLVKNMVILGTSFPRSAAIGVSAGHGIIGTDEGLSYMWDLKAGNNVEILHDFKGDRVSHIATDDSTPSATAVAGENGQLWIYLHQ